MFDSMIGQPPFVSRIPAYRSGVWYGVGAGPLITNAALAADVAYAFPIWVERATTIGRIAMTVGTAVPSVSGRLALYTGRVDSVAPFRLLAGDTAALDMGSVANTVLEYAFTAIPVSRGVYWGVTNFNGAAQPRTATNNSTIGTSGVEFQSMLGALSPLSVHGSGSTVQLCRVSAALTYAAAWPVEFPAVTVEAGAPGSPLIAWRIN